jgi:predicted RND superfamily exporter protein
MKNDKKEHTFKNSMTLFLLWLVMTIICCIFYDFEYALNVTAYLFGLLFAINMVIIMGHESYAITISLLVLILVAALALAVHILIPLEN